MSFTELQISTPEYFGVLIHLSTIILVGPLLQELLDAKLTQDTQLYSSVRPPQVPAPSFLSSHRRRRRSSRTLVVLVVLDRFLVVERSLVLTR